MGVVRGVPRLRVHPPAVPRGVRRRRRRHRRRTRCWSRRSPGSCGSSSLFVLISRLACEPILLVRQRGAQAAGRPAGRGGGMAGELLPVGVARGQRRRVMKHPRRARRRPLRAQRLEVVDHERRRLRLLHRVRQDRSRRRATAGSARSSSKPTRPGFSVAKLESKMGMRGSPTGEIVFDDVRVPAENLIGEEDRAFGYAMGALDGSRPLVGAQAVGIAQGALDAATRYVTEREQFGQPGGRVPGPPVHARRHGDAGRGGAPARVQRVRAARRRCAGHDAGRSAMAKLFASRHRDVGDHRRVQLFGGVGLHQGLPGRAHDARRQGDPDLRGHQPDPAHRDRPTAPARPMTGRRLAVHARPSARPVLARPDRFAARRERCGRRCSTGCSPATTAAPSASASRTPTARVDRRVGRSASRTRCAGSVSSGTRGRSSRAPRTQEYLAAADDCSPPAHAYECFCTEDEVKARNDAAPRAGRPPGYDGHCRDLSAEQRAALAAEGRPRSIRFRTPDEGVSHFVDAVRGDVRSSGRPISDFVIVRSDGNPIFFLANAVDDLDDGHHARDPRRGPPRLDAPRARAARALGHVRPARVRAPAAHPRSRPAPSSRSGTARSRSRSSATPGTCPRRS